MQKLVISVFTCQNMAIFRNPSKILNFFEFFKKKFGPDCCNSVQGHQKNSFYPNHITDATMKNH